MRIKSLVLFPLLIGLFLSSFMKTSDIYSHSRNHELFLQLRSLKKEGWVTEKKIHEKLTEYGIDNFSHISNRRLAHILNGKSSDQELADLLLQKEKRRIHHRQTFRSHNSNTNTSKQFTSCTQISGNQSIITNIIPDFQVNENIGKCDKELPKIAIDQNGNYILVWIDYRNGDPVLYGQRFDMNGIPLGSNFRITEENAIGYDSFWGVFTDIAIAIDIEGNFVVVWTDCRNWDLNKSEIYGQFFTFNGNALGNNFKISNYNGYASQYSPAVMMTNSGSFIVVWTDERHGSSDIYCQIFDRYGRASGDNFRINEGAHTNDQFSPAIIMDDINSFVVVWVDRNDEIYNIRGQRFDITGKMLGEIFLVNDELSTDYKENPSMGVDENRNLVIAWLDKRNDTIDIYSQRFDINGANGVNYKVNDEMGGISYYSFAPVIAMDNNGNYMITWCDEGKNGIFIQNFNIKGEALGSNYKVNNNVSIDEWNMALAANNKNLNLGMAWKVNRDFYSQIYNNSGDSLTEVVQANDDIGSSWQAGPAIAVDDSGNFIIVWWNGYDGQGEGTDIYGKRYSKAGTLLGSQFKVNEENDLLTPEIAIDGKGNFVVVWPSDNSNNNCNILGQRFNSAATPVGVNFQINDDSDEYWHWLGNQSVTADYNGNLMVSWRIWPRYATYGQSYNNLGVAQGSNFFMNWSENTSIIADNLGKFIGVWNDWNTFINGCFFDLSGNKIGEVFELNTDSLSGMESLNDWDSHPEIAVDKDGNFITIWDDEFSGQYNIYGQCFDNTLNRKNGNFRINDQTLSLPNCHPVVASDKNGNFVVVWEDWRNGNADIYSQLYDRNGNNVGSNYRVINDTGGKYQGYPAVARWNKYVYYVWEDNRIPGQGYDIFARVDLINSTPGSPVLSSPVNGIFINDRRPLFKFQVPADFDGDPLHIKFDLATNSDFTIPVAGSPFESQNSVTGFSPVPPISQENDSCRYSLESELVDGTYFWRVSTWDGYVFSASSPVFSFSIDNTPPLTSNHYPVKDTTGVSVSDSIVVHIKDALSGVNQSGIILKINGEQVLPTITGTPAEYILIYRPTENFQYHQTVQVTIDAEDNLSNKMVTENYSFTTQNITDVAENSNESNKPLKFGIKQNYPNPFNQSTRISYSLASEQVVLITVLNINGQKVRTLLNQKQSAGNYIVQWNGKNHSDECVTSGVYLVRLETPDFSEVRKILLVR